MTTSIRWGLCLAGTVILLTGLLGQAQESKYPKVNTTRTWVVDAKWPQKPADYVWGMMSGVAVDAKDNVYIFTRAEPPVQVYSAKGKFLRGWGTKDIKSAHHIKIDHEGNVWISDIGNHVVEKYTPEGKLLLTIGTKGKAGRDKSHLNMPTDIAVTKSGDVYISDGYGNARVVHSTNTANSSMSGASWVTSQGSSASRTPSPSIPRTASMWPTATTSASRCSMRRASSSRNGAT